MTMETTAQPLEIEAEMLAPELDAPTLEEAEIPAAPPAPQPASGLPVGITTPSLEAIYDVPVKVQAILGRSRMPVSDLMQLTAGHVVELDRKVGEPVDVFVNNRLIARGEVVMIDNSLGITLTEIVRQDD